MVCLIGSIICVGFLRLCDVMVNKVDWDPLCSPHFMSMMSHSLITPTNGVIYVYVHTPKMSLDYVCNSMYDVGEIY